MPAPPAPASSPPDWSTIHEEILCPLCSYNLRGLAEARCPECGYRFEWPDLLDTSRRKHPYLFEHHQERNYRSFVRTLLGGLRSRRFWGLLRPEQPGNARRLLLYHVMVSLMALTVWAALWGKAMWQVYSWGQWPLVRGITAAQRQTFRDQYRLFPPSYELLHEARWMVWYEGQGEMRTFTLALLCWPLLTFATLLLFQASMRRARVRTIHVARCVVYCSDVVAWAFVALTGIALFTPSFRAFRGTSPGRPWLAAALMLLVVMVIAYRLAIAFRLYLQFDRPARTVLASQTIVALVVLVWATVNDWWMYLM